MKTLSATLGLIVMATTASHSMSVGGGAGYFTGSVTEPKTDDTQRWTLSAPAWSFKIVDPSGSLMSFLGTATSNYSHQLGAQQKAEEEAKRNGVGSATYEVSNSVTSTGSTQTFELLWAHDGEFDYSDATQGASTDNAPDQMTLQGTLTANIAAWNGIGGIPLSALAYWKMVVGYMDLKAQGKAGYSVAENKAWFTFPFGAALVYDAPLKLSGKVYGGYDPITGLVSIWSPNVHQAWEYGAAAEWTPLPWLVAETGIVSGVTNLDSEKLWKFGTTAITFGARIDFDGF